MVEMEFVLPLDIGGTRSQALARTPGNDVRTSELSASRYSGISEDHAHY